MGNFMKRMKSAVSIFLCLIIIQSCIIAQTKAFSDLNDRILILDNEYATIYYLDIKPMVGLTGYYVYLAAKNNTESRIQIFLDECSVNNYMCTTGSAGKEIVPGKASRNCHGFFPRIEFEKIYNVEFKISIKNLDSHEYVFESELITVIIDDSVKEDEIPTEIYVQSPFMDNEFASMSFQKMSYDSSGIKTYHVSFFVQNKTEHTISISITDASIDDWMCDFVSHNDTSTISKNNRSMANFGFSPSFEFDNPRFLEFTVHIKDEETKEELYVSSPIVIFMQ